MHSKETNLTELRKILSEIQAALLVVHNLTLRLRIAKGMTDNLINVMEGSNDE